MRGSERLASYNQHTARYDSLLIDFISRHHKKELSGIRLDGKALYLGTSSSSANKMLQTKNLCDFMGVESGRVVWYDGTETVFKN